MLTTNSIDTWQNTTTFKCNVYSYIYIYDTTDGQVFISLHRFPAHANSLLGGPQFVLAIGYNAHAPVNTTRQTFSQQELSYVRHLQGREMDRTVHTAE